MVNVNVTGGEMSQAEINSYIDRAQKLYPEKTIQTIDLKIDGDFVDVDYHFADVPFQRIRRITGYLVGTTDRFNNSKRAEERDRVKHDKVRSLTENKTTEKPTDSKDKNTSSKKESAK